MTKAVKPKSIPDGWDVRKLGEILKLNYGKGLPADNRIEGKYPVYGSNGVVGSHNQCLVKTEGIIVGRKGSAGLVHYSKNPFYPIDTTFYITQEDTSLHLPYLFYLLNYCKLSKIKGDVGVPGLNREMAYLEKVMYPPFFEQHNIAHILSKIQSAIEAQEKIIQTTTELKKALMQKFFTEGLKGEAQKETEIGLVPKSWQVIGLGDVFELTSGKTRPTELTPMPKNGFLYPVYGGNGVLGYSKESLIDFKTIVLGRVGAYCGNVYLTDNKSWISDNALYAKVFLRECDLYYLSVALKGLNLNRLRNTGGQPLISQSIVYSQKIAFPKIDEQIEIAKTLEQTDKKINMAIEKKNVLQSLFKSMLHHLMTGQIRVKDLRFS